MKHSKLISLLVSVLILQSLVACSDEDRDSLTLISNFAENLDKIENAEDSVFNADCTDKIALVTDSMEDEQITPELQQEFSGLFNECVSAIEAELKLTTDEYSDAEDNSVCTVGIAEIRKGLPKLEQDIAEFSNLPNTNEDERLAVNFMYPFVSMDVMAKGSAAALNRIVACPLEIPVEMLES
ncbi:MAG: hypothetical protein KUG78_14725 [Kangiellaceae bacterium]|nr:hypothetical protein [Kangiellaceae bacterium]